MHGLFFLSGLIALIFSYNKMGGEKTYLKGLQTEQVDNPIIMGVLILLAVAAACLIFYLAWRILYHYILRLFLKPEGPAEPVINSELLFRLLERMMYMFNGTISLIRAIRQNLDTSSQGFVRLMKWGKRSGAEKKPGETSLEYAGRLKERFQPLKEEIETIISAFQREVYGEATIQPHTLQQVSSAVKSIHSPVFWILRIKSILKK